MEVLTAEADGSNSSAYHHHPSSVQPASPSPSRTCQTALVAAASVATEARNKASSLRKREVTLSRISIYIAFVFLFCHSIRIIPNIYELITTYTQVGKKKAAARARIEKPNSVHITYDYTCVSSGIHSFLRCVALSRVY